MSTENWRQSYIQPHVESFSTTPRVVADGDVIKRCSAERAQQPDEGIEEAQRGLPARDARVVEQCHDRGERRRGARGAVDEACLAIHDDREVDALGCYVGDGLCPK